MNRAPASSNSVLGAALIVGDAIVPRLRIPLALNENRERGSLSRYQGVTCKPLTRSRERNQTAVKINEP